MNEKSTNLQIIRFIAAILAIFCVLNSITQRTKIMNCYT